MSDEIQFGELEESVPERRLRPSENKQFAVVAVGDPADCDLPIFVDMDVMLDMERHALTDTTVELGGVMLGGQYEDENGQPFVLVSVNLRAEHYESTKGSFKFTHETWEAFTRQRDEFPDDLEMVGWYHTHPDWGVFLSGMDMFICDNFFNRPLDIALVIDPCRDDRGMFQWLPAGADQQIHRTDGFYLFSSQLRQSELIEFCQHLQMGESMSRDPRYVPSGTSPSAPVVHIHDQRGQTMAGVITGAMMFQFLLILVVAWGVFSPLGEEEVEKDNKELVAIVEKLDAIEDAVTSERLVKSQLWEAELKLQAVERALVEAGRLAPGELSRLAENEAQIAALNEHLRTSAAQTRTLSAELAEANDRKNRAMRALNRTEDDLGKVNVKVSKLSKANRALEKDAKNVKSESASNAIKLLMSDYRWVVGLILATITLIGGTAYATLSLSRVSQAALASPGGGIANEPPPVEPNWTESEEDEYGS